FLLNHEDVNSLKSLSLLLFPVTGANVNAKDQGLLTPLHRAARAVELLLKHGAEVNTRDKFWHTPLHMAAAKWAAGCALALIPHVCSLDVADRSGRTPLHHAAHSGHGEMVNLLLSKGANLSAKDKKERQAIHWAAYLGHVEVVKLLLSHSADVMSKDKRGYTPLHAASASGQLDVVKYLMRLIVEIDEPNAFGNTALHMACYTGQDSVATELVNCGANINQANHHGSTPLHLAAASSSGVLCLELLINNGADVNVQNKEGKSPLHMAAMHGRFTGSQIIIQNGAEVNEPDLTGCSPLIYGHCRALYLLITGQHPVNFSLMKIPTLCLKVSFKNSFRGETNSDYSEEREHEASLQRSRNFYLYTLDGIYCAGLTVNTFSYYMLCVFRCLDFLLDNGANPTLKNSKGYSAVHYAAAYGNKQHLELLLEISFNCLEEVESNIPVSPLHLAAYYGHCEALRLLSETLVSLDVRDIDGRTALYLAAQRGFASCVEVLLKHEASYTLKEHKHKWTALHAAGVFGQMDCLLLLVNREQSADIIDSPDTQGQTALMLAALGRHTDCVHILLEKGANADAADKKGFTALHRAAMLGSEDCVSALLEHGASALCRDSQGRTPLHLTASLGHTELLRTLLIAAMKADPLDSILDYRGCTPTHWAAYHGHEGCLHILLENKLFSNQEGNHFTPLHCALVNGHDVAAELLVKTVGPQVVNVSDAKGRTPLHAAAHSGSVAGVQLVLAQGAEVNAVDHSGCSALMVAADCGQTMAVEFLLHKAKPDLTLVDVNNNTALHLACSKGHEMCALLILGEINDSSLINATNSALQMPLHIAARKGLATVVQVLLSRGAAVMAVDEEGSPQAPWGL
uniref:Ankyrin repeat domain 52 n=1 Tax=Sparus aurata TaxID=8175 RepID=A0A671YFD0_SPAAU